MRTRSFQQMLSECGIDQLEADDGNSRNVMLMTYPYSVIIEGEYMEFDSLDIWIEIKLGPESKKWLFYVKTGYNFGFAEYFFKEESHANTIAEIVPNIYTVYPHSYPPNATVRSNGYNEHIAYDPRAEKGIVIAPEAPGSASLQRACLDSPSVETKASPKNDTFS